MRIAVEQSGLRVVDLRPDDADDDGRHGVGEERDDAVEAGAAQPADAAAGTAADRDQAGNSSAMTIVAKGTTIASSMLLSTACGRCRPASSFV